MEKQEYKELQATCVNGGMKAFARLYETVYREMYYSAYYSLADDADAVEVVTNAVRSTFNNIARLHTENAFLTFILMQVRPNPHFVRRTGGYKRVGKRTTYSEPRLFLLIRGEWREFSIYDITETEEMSSRWLLEEKLLEELLSLVERNAPKRPNKS